jgi:septum formation protein
MLRRLAGRAHEVLTGVALRQGSRTVSEVARTVVQFTQLSEEDLAWYVRSGEPRDKAGAYGIQGLASRFVERIDGSYPNVVGLPVALVAQLLRQLPRRGGG